MKIFNTTILSIAFLASSVSFAQEAEESTEEATTTFSVSGSVDTYFRSAEFAPYTSFANLPLPVGYDPLARERPHSLPDPS